MSTNSSLLTEFCEHAIYSGEQQASMQNSGDNFKQKYSHIDWRPMAGMRDKLIHDYLGVDYDIV
ncbi:MAG: DUF86 domain-containing protein [candidate division KSB1 bacterium]|nr:DUF86 domain-containing protein [candidate division KSB1 bacterium]MDZ7301344.1 DUF86 domain-containing protein [candidate division KSB1 bacterium]MDZ7310771.1 DUF86 domain-containing protein [candidate division KSB1 bacterium]